ncbi:MAG: cupin domain-containing protein [Chthonomonas sp.]|nr:cupin domain-containing protein [Chthonomonas sp.]
MIKRAEERGWEGVPTDEYKNEPGTWMNVTREVLFNSPESGFETRYFRLDAGGYSSFERHQHEHCVVVLDGAGEVRLDNTWHQIGPRDVIHVMPGQPHQFRAGEHALGILCIVDRHRDRPELLGNDPNDRTS